MRILLLILLPFFSFAQNSDWKELQGMIDAAKTSPTGIVTIARNYTIDKPLIVHDWNGSQYANVSMTIQGYATMWDNNNRSVIRATFDDAPILSIQKGKGVIIRGVNFQARQGRDSRFSPQAAIAIDPFSGLLPADSGYPSLREWYRGPQTRSGSTGIRIEDCTFNGTICGVIVSPNGYTQNAELITIQNCRSYAVRYVIVGCQAQEKGNRIINLGAWGPTNCVFVFNRYGAAQPGNWIIDGVNVAGSVDSLIYRLSGGWGPMYMTNVFAENVKTIGIWVAGSGDAFINSVINLKRPNELGYFPENTMDAGGLIFNNVNIRYYGWPQTPMLLLRAGTIAGGSFYQTPITTRFGWQPTTGYNIVQPFWPSTDTVINNTASLKVRAGQNVSVGDHVLFMQGSDWSFLGQGQIESISNDTAKVKYITRSIKELKNYRIGIYK